MTNDNIIDGGVKTVAAPQLRRRGLTLETDQEELAMSLKTYRLRTGKTQEELAKEWGLSRFTIIRCERCKPVSWQTMYRVFNSLLKALEIEAKQDRL